MDTTAFYASASALSFTLLGFWWVIVQLRPAAFVATPEARRFSLLVSLFFVIPGLLSLASLVTPGQIWRVAFGLAGAIGIVAVAYLGRGYRTSDVRIPELGWLALLNIPLSALVLLIALFPDIGVPIGLNGLQAEGLAMVAILLLGVLLAWFLFTAPMEDTRPRE